MRRRAFTDDDLIRATAQGDARAFTELMRRHRRWVTSILLAFTHNRDEAEDLTQEAFTRLYRHASSYRNQGGFVAWLRRIAMNVGNSYLQRRSPQALVPLATLDETPSGDQMDPLRTLIGHSLESAVQEAIESLPEEQRDALLLRCFLSLSVPEIARRQNCPEGTVKSRLSHGLRRVRQSLAATWENDEPAR